MANVACVNVVSRDHPPRVNAEGESTLAGAGARVWSLEGGEVAVLGAQEAVIHKDLVIQDSVVSHDRSRWVDAKGLGDLARARNVEGDDGCPAIILSSCRKAQPQQYRAKQTAAHRLDRVGATNWAKIDLLLMWFSTSF